jgi:hypothetical protein
VSDLNRSMGPTAGTFMALAAVLGRGMMIPPGVSYHALGRSAWVPWTIAAISVIPLLCCYAWLGQRYPSASGVAYYAEVALGRTTGRAVGVIAAVGLFAAVPATAITGGLYVAQFLGLPGAAWMFPIGVLVLATMAAYLGTGVSGRLQVGLIIGLFVLVTCIAVAALSVHGVAPPSVELPAYSDLGSVLTAVYVAFAGWETVAFTFEEHKRSDPFTAHFRDVVRHRRVAVCPAAAGPVRCRRFHRRRTELRSATGTRATRARPTGSPGDARPGGGVHPGESLRGDAGPVPADLRPGQERLPPGRAEHGPRTRPQPRVRRCSRWARP